MSASISSIASTQSSRGRWADDFEDDNMSINTESETQEGQGQGPPCKPHFYPDPSRRVLKEGDIMYFIRRPWIPTAGCAVPGLDQPTSLRCLCDPDEFYNRMEEIEELKELVKDDPAKEAIMPVVKRRKGQDGQVVTNAAEAENTAPKSNKKSGSAKRSRPAVQEKERQASDFLDFFGLPADPAVQRSSLGVVIKNLRGDLRSRNSNATKPRNLSDAQWAEHRLQKATIEIAKYLVIYYNTPVSSWVELQKLIFSKGPNATINFIIQWLEMHKETKVTLDDMVINEIFDNFHKSISRFGQSFEEKQHVKRHHLRKSQHKLKSTKVCIDKESCLLGCYSGKSSWLLDHFTQQGERDKADEVRNKPNIGKDLRNEKGIHILAFEEEKFGFTAMPGPTHAFPEGYIFVGCEICQGAIPNKDDCSCTDWLDSLGITHCLRETVEFDLDEMIVPAQLDNYCFGGKRWAGTQGILNLRQFTADENGNNGVQLVGLTKESKDQK